jgi:hypothetical protein
MGVAKGMRAIALGLCLPRSHVQRRLRARHDKSFALLIFTFLPDERYDLPSHVRHIECGERVHEPESDAERGGRLYDERRRLHDLRELAFHTVERLVLVECTGSGLRNAENTPEPNVAGRGVDRLRKAGRWPVSLAVVRRAEM